MLLHVELRRSVPRRVRPPLPQAAALPRLHQNLKLPTGFGMETCVVGVEGSLLQVALNQSGGVRPELADVLGISYRSFRH